MARSRLQWDESFDGRLWTAELRLSNSPARMWRNPRMRVTAFPIAGGAPAPRIEIWEAPLNITVDRPMDVCASMLSVTSVMYSRMVIGDVQRHSQQ